ncbi:MAG: hypothetical protein AAF170_01815 [Bacteroidota bacterium]
MPQSDTTDVVPNGRQTFLDRFRPGTRPAPDTLSRQRPSAQTHSAQTPPPTSPSQPPPAPEPTPAPPPEPVPLERSPASSMARAELGTFSIYTLIQGVYQETTALNRVQVSVEIPRSWRATNGQMFDARGNKVGEMGPGVFAYRDGTTCASQPDSEMDGPPDEKRRFSTPNASGVYSRTATYCGGGVDTYSGACHVHSYCVQPSPGGVGLTLTFLELASTASAEQKALYDRVVDSIRLSP